MTPICPRPSRGTGHALTTTGISCHRPKLGNGSTRPSALMGRGRLERRMNRVGQHGRGESVWLGLVPALDVDEICADCEEPEGTWSGPGLSRPRREAPDSPWKSTAGDGRVGTSRGAFFDDGTPPRFEPERGVQDRLLAQTWSVISGAASAARQGRGHGVGRAAPDFDETTNSVLLLTPIRSRGARSGYIKGYPPGVT